MIIEIKNSIEKLKTLKIYHKKIKRKKWMNNIGKTYEAYRITL